MISEREKQIRQIVAHNIVHYRQKLGLSQLDLANKLKVTSPVVQHWERGRSFPSLDMLVKIVDALDAGSIDDFCRRKAKISYSKAA